jgi:hypothetical protein
VFRLLIALALPLSAQWVQPNWSMTPAQAKAAEHAGVSYTFAKDKLVRVRYTFVAEHTDLNDFIRDFDTIESQLAEKYGPPATDRAIWTDDSTQQEPKSYLDQDRATATGILPSDLYVGLAVSLGHLKMYTEWTAGQTKIRHTLTGADNKVIHQLEFLAAEIAPHAQP